MVCVNCGLDPAGVAKKAAVVNGCAIRLYKPTTMYTLQPCVEGGVQ